MKTNPIYTIANSGLKFSGPFYSLTVTSMGNGVASSVARIGNNGYTTPLYAMPDAGYVLSGFETNYGTVTNNSYTFANNDAIVSAYFEEQIAPPFPPAQGNYTNVARLYTSSNLDHITLNTVSWYYDGGSPLTYSDSNCTNELTYLSEWNDFSPNTVLPTIGQNEYGTYVDIFTNSLQNYYDFCVILGNDRVTEITDDSWMITRVEVYAINDVNCYYRINNSPEKGQWFRDTSDWNVLN